MEMVLCSWLNSRYVGGAAAVSTYKYKNLFSTTATTSSTTLSHFNINNNNNTKLIITLSRRRKQLRCLSLFTDYSPQLQIITSASFGALLLSGGLFAYTKSGSKGSLYGGLAGSSLMSAAFVLMQSSETREIGDSLAFGSALLFTCVFGIRLAATRKIIPAGPLLALSISALVVFISAYLQDSQSLM